MDEMASRAFTPNLRFLSESISTSCPGLCMMRAPSTTISFSSCDVVLSLCSDAYAAYAAAANKNITIGLTIAIIVFVFSMGIVTNLNKFLEKMQNIMTFFYNSINVWLWNSYGAVLRACQKRIKAELQQRSSAQDALVILSVTPRGCVGNQPPKRKPAPSIRLPGSRKRKRR